MCRCLIGKAVLSVATDFGKHHFILIQDHLVLTLTRSEPSGFWCESRSAMPTIKPALQTFITRSLSNTMYFIYDLLSGNSLLLDVPLLCLILKPDLMIQWLSLFVTLWYFTTQSSGIIHYTRTRWIPLKNLHARRVVFFCDKFRANECRAELARTMPSAAEIHA